MAFALLALLGTAGAAHALGEPAGQCAAAAAEAAPPPPPPPPRLSGCDFRIVGAREWARSPLPWEHWEEPTLITGAAAAGEPWAAPFRYLGDLVGGRYDGTTVAVGSGAATTLFGGNAPGRATLAAFRAGINSSTDDAVFDTQNSGAGRHVDLPIPGVPTEPDSGSGGGGWWNVLSVGAAGAGLPLHEHGAAWIAIGKGSKDWALYPPAANHPPSFVGRPAVEVTCCTLLSLCQAFKQAAERVPD